MSNLRINILFLILFFIFVGLIMRLFQIQILKSEHYTRRAISQTIDTVKILPLRGSIYDRNGILLAYSLRMYWFGADIYSLKNFYVDSIAKRIKSVLKGRKTNYAQLMKGGNITEIVLEKNIDEAKKTEIEKLKLYGIRFNKDVEIGEDGYSYSLLMNVDKSKDEYLKEISAKIAKVTGRDWLYYYNEMNNARGRIVYFERELYQREKDSISALNIWGLFFEEKSKRIYQFGGLASNVLGCLNKDLEALDGIERQYDKDLRGVAGFNVIMKDGNGYPVTVLKNESKAVVDGADIYLTIDKTYQKVLEEELKYGVETNSALGGSGIIIDPNTGEILAMADYPTFNPEEGLKNVALLKNKNVTVNYDPGSTFKTFTLAAALDSKISDLNDVYYAENGTYKFANVTIRDVHPMANISLREALVQSSNIVFAKLSHKFDSKLFYNYITNFGFGGYTGIDLPYETQGIVQPLEKWNKVEKAFISHGYSISCTPLQLITGYTACINGGELVKPHIMRMIVHKDSRVDSNIIFKRRRVISEETSNLLRSALQDVVERGTAKHIKMENLKIGGKTGTASKFVGNKYSKESYYASFIGFYPVDNPKVLCLIVIDSPRGNYYGGAVAAPIFSAITRKLFKAEEEAKFSQEKILFEPKDYRVEVPSFIGKRKEVAERILDKLNFKPTFEGEGEFVIAQSFDELTYEVRLVLGDLKNESNMCIVPDVKGISLREAIRKLKMAGLEFSFVGQGYVVSQSLESGKNVEKGTVCKLVLRDEI